MAIRYTRTPAPSDATKSFTRSGKTYSERSMTLKTNRECPLTSEEMWVLYNSDPTRYFGFGMVLRQFCD